MTIQLRSTLNMLPTIPSQCPTASESRCSANFRDLNVVVGAYSEAAADGIPSDPALLSPADGSSTDANA